MTSSLTELWPVMVSASRASIGTGESRVLKVSCPCAASVHVNTSAAFKMPAVRNQKSPKHLRYRLHLAGITREGFPTTR